MYIFSNKVIPIDKIFSDEISNITFKDIVQNARIHPWHFFAEAFALCLMVIGGSVVFSWAFEIGELVGQLI
jgi:hypothetical protein